MYKLQYTELKDIDGKVKSPQKFQYKDTGKIYDDFNQASKDRVDFCREFPDKYFKISKI